MAKKKKELDENAMQLEQSLAVELPALPLEEVTQEDDKSTVFLQGSEIAKMIVMGESISVNVKNLEIAQLKYQIANLTVAMRDSERALAAKDLTIAELKKELALVKLNNDPKKLVEICDQNLRDAQDAYRAFGKALGEKYGIDTSKYLVNTEELSLVLE